MKLYILQALVFFTGLGHVLAAVAVLASGRIAAHLFIRIAAFAVLFGFGFSTLASVDNVLHWRGAPEAFWRWSFQAAHPLFVLYLMHRIERLDVTAPLKTLRLFRR